MMTVLVPTDFSNSAKAAIEYAAMLAQEARAKIILFHAIPKRGGVLKDIDGYWTSRNQRRLKRMANALIRNGLPPASVDFRVVHDFPLRKAVNNYLSENNVNLVVMGAKGETNDPGVWLGGSAAEMVEQTGLPVITVPKGAKKAKPQHIVYASDLQNIEREVLSLASFASQFNARLHVVHVQTTPPEKALDLTSLQKKLVKKTGYDNLAVVMLGNPDIEQAIDYYCSANQADLLVLFKHTRGFFEDLFHRSITKSISYQTKTALLVVKD